MLSDINKNLIKQYLLEMGISKGIIYTLREEAYINKQYYNYRQGLLKINDTDFLQWWKEKQKDSQQFGQFLLENGYLRENDYTVEIASDDSLSCTKSIVFPLRRTLMVFPAGEGITPHYNVPVQRGILVINGVYINQQPHMMKMNHSNCFVAGFIDGSNQKYNEQLLEYYKRLQATLHILRSRSSSVLEPKVKMIEKGKVHVLIRASGKEQLRTLANRVRSYKYDDDQIGISDR